MAAKGWRTEDWVAVYLGFLIIAVVLAAFSWKWRLNRTLRRIVESPAAVSAGEHAASAAPMLMQSLVSIAGDCAVCP